ncbi:hypothetical protein [Hyphococcus sp.]|uniref:hypothetical protein n=1 Tax=Hyphococcus sp. TaxID=2038636 RepID=UPI0035C73B37
MPRQSAIQTPEDRENVFALLRQGLSLSKVSERTGFTISQVRTFKSNLGMESCQPETDDESHTIQAVIAQNKRLNVVLAEVRGKRPIDYELILKVETKLSDNHKTLIGLQKDQLLEERSNERAATDREIRSLINSIVHATDNCVTCKKNIRQALGEFMAHEKQYTY